MKKKKVIPYLKIKTQSKRIVLRPYKLTDFSICKSSQGDRLPNCNKFDEEIPTPKSRTYQVFKNRVERHRKHGRMKVHFILAVFERKSGSYIGQIDFFVINKQLRWANLGYQIQNQYWGKGYATEACRLALNIAFSELDFHRIEAATEIQNRASIKVAKKSGMTYEGKRNKFFPENGGIDMVVYGANSIDYKCKVVK